ncbi:MAG: isoprenyl transferase [Clostridiales bacterium]|nr:isoprenyl transferase [Clostridiales bacterium]
MRDLQHVAIIMDGNGRWAKERGLNRLRGHYAGVESLIEIVRTSSDLGIKYLTVYAFSTENWKRPLEEISGLFKLLISFVARELENLVQNNVKVGILGERSVLPEDVNRSIDKALESTKNCTGLSFNIALNYGGRAEILRAAKKFAAQCAQGEADAENFSENDFSKLMYTADIPDPDLIIRTGGERRLSNFLTWQSAYSELYVTDIYWPDFSPEEYEKALDDYRQRDRRFGGIK